MKLKEIFNFGQINLITEKAKLPKYALAKLSYSFAKADERNLNNREYPEAILKREVVRKNEEIKDSKIVGTLDHPTDGRTKLDSASHVLTALRYDKNIKIASAESYVLNTTSGKNFMTILDSGIKLGASMRGYGNIGSDRIVKDDYRLETVDIVLKPSFGKDAIISQGSIVESANSILETEKKSGVEKELKTLQRKECIPQKVEIKDIYWEARLADMDPKIMAENINKEIDIKEKKLEDDLAKRQTFYNECLSAGMDVGDIPQKVNDLMKTEKEPVEEGNLSEEEKAEALRVEAEKKKNGRIDMLVKEAFISGATSEDLKKFLKD